MRLQHRHQAPQPEPPTNKHTAGRMQYKRWPSSTASTAKASDSKPSANRQASSTAKSRPSKQSPKHKRPSSTPTPKNPSGTSRTSTTW
jgi:hypothetical protein